MGRPPRSVCRLAVGWAGPRSLMGRLQASDTQPGAPPCLRAWRSALRLVT